MHALSDYRAQNMAIEELVDVVSECFDHRLVRVYLRHTALPLRRIFINRPLPHLLSYLYSSPSAIGMMVGGVCVRDP